MIRDEPDQAGTKMDLLDAWLDLPSRL